MPANYRDGMQPNELEGRLTGHGASDFRSFMPHGPSAYRRHRLTVTIMDDLANDDTAGAGDSEGGNDDESEVQYLTGKRFLCGKLLALASSLMGHHSARSD